MTRCCLLGALSNDKKAITFAITDTKLYVPDLTLSNEDNATLLEHLKSGCKRTISTKSFNRKTKPILRFLNRSKFSRSK